MRFGNEQAVEELKVRVAQLEAAVHTLVGVGRQPGSPLAAWLRTYQGDPLPGLQPFVTQYDLITGHPTRVGVGDTPQG